MPKKICAVLYLATMVALAVLITSAEVGALEDACLPPDSFTTFSGFTVTLVDVSPEPVGVNWYRYTYQLNKSGSKKKKPNAPAPNHFNIAIPNCCPGTITILQDPDRKAVDLHIYEPGAGDPTSNWLSGYFQAFVAKFTSHPIDGTYSFLADTNTTAETSICLKVGNQLECGAIRGPTCRTAVSGDSLSVVMGPKKWVFKRTDPALRCYDEVYGCEKDTHDNACRDLIEEDPISSIGFSNEDATIVSAEGECIVWAQFGSATTRCAIIGGKKYCQ